MSLLDELKRHAFSLIASHAGEDETGADAHGGLVEQAFLLIKSQGLNTVLDRFGKSGLTEVVASWVGRGENLPIDPEQIRRALGSESLQAIAAKLGLPLDQVSGMLSQVLPALVDKLTPNGVVEDALPPDQ